MKKSSNKKSATTNIDNATNQNRVVAYIRVSTEQQSEQGQSLEAQQEKIQAYAALYNLEIVEIIVEVGSAKDLNREGLQRALRLLEAGKASAILVVKLDRLTRSVADLGKLIETYFAPGKASLMSVAEQIDTRTAAGRLVLNILASVSQWEREAIGERTSAVLQHKKSKGEYTGGPIPYGFVVVNGMLVADPHEQEIVRLAKELRSSGLSLAKIASALDKRGLRSRNGKVFVATQINRMVANG